MLNVRCSMKEENERRKMFDGKWFMDNVEFLMLNVERKKEAKETSVNYRYVTCSSLKHLYHC